MNTKINNMIKRVRAVIIKDNKILLIKRVKPEDKYWAAPGGGVDPGESDKQALIRECQEELGVNVEVCELFLDIISEKPATKGQLEFFYECKILSGKVGTGDGPEYQPDSGYIGSYQPEWRALDELSSLELRPRQLKEKLLIHK
jgi:8-oxo-dGTP diphosphatase